MTGWRFYPLAEHPEAGILVSPERQPFAARFINLEDAKQQRPARLEAPVPQPCPTVKMIQEAVATYYGFAPEHMTRLNREPRYSHPRQVAMYLSRSLTRASFPQIGRRFHRDHSTVIHAIQKVEERIRDDNHTAKDLAALREVLAA